MFEDIKDKAETFYYKSERFIKDWVYPAYNLKNLLWNRYDLIKIQQLKPWGYSDKVEVSLWVNTQLIVDFIEKEKPEKYVCWYKDDEGNDVGHRYGEYDAEILYPEYKDKYIMDIIKEIYNWWKVDYPLLCKEKDYVLSYWCENIHGKLSFSEEDENGFSTILNDNSGCPKTIEELKQKNLDWNILNKYFQEKDLLNEEVARSVMENLDKRIFHEEQKYLHLCIEVRPYLWT